MNALFISCSLLGPPALADPGLARALRDMYTDVSVETDIHDIMQIFKGKNLFVLLL